MAKKLGQKNALLQYFASIFLPSLYISCHIRTVFSSWPKYDLSFDWFAFALDLDANAVADPQRVLTHE
jgi:hypothetical protein